MTKPLHFKARSIIAMYFRATINGKIFQLRFLDEVNPDSGKAERSQTTGHLLVTLPLTRGILWGKTKPRPEVDTEERPSQILEVTPQSNEMDFSRIVQGKIPNLDDLPPLEDVDE